MEGLKKYTNELSNKGAAGDIAAEAVVLHDRVEELLKVDVIQNSRDSIDAIEVQFNKSTSLDKVNNFLGEVKVEVKPKGKSYLDHALYMALKIRGCESLKPSLVVSLFATISHMPILLYSLVA